MLPATSVLSDLVQSYHLRVLELSPFTSYPEKPKHRTFDFVVLLKNQREGEEGYGEGQVL